MQKINLFDGLENENNVSTLLVNLIKKYPTLENKWKKFLKINNIDLIETEIPLKRKKQEYGRIDIHIENNSNEILIENKVWRYRELTDNQPSNYIKYIEDEEDKKDSKLIFLIPKHYHHENELKDKKLSIRYWEDFIVDLKKDDFHKMNIFIEEFVEFMENILSISYIHLTKSEKILLNKKGISMKSQNIPQIMKKLISNVDSVIDGGKIKVTNRNKPTEYDGYGYELKLENSELFIWFGIEYDIWQKYESPIIIWITGAPSEEQEKILQDEGFEYYTHEKDKDTLIYSFYDDLDKENISEIILEKLNKILKI